MMEVKFHELNSIKDEKIMFAVIMARYKDKWIFVKHKDRESWEIPGGHREENEDIMFTARRELFEETGAKKYSIVPVCIYSVNKDGSESFGQLFYAEVETIGKLPDYEISQVEFFEAMPKELTYPLIQPCLFNCIEKLKLKLDMEGVN
ncbi:NUDIX domain-containing protein [Clostridium intestinale]|uniref:NUDIX hydrolase n=1 Tax=Clostridium intestinale TaxID=36845 RepID=UPI0028E8273A|nr:NUDIX domain-containing protein [Clostridium intestinale]